ncbi:MAG TPA: hypothetical protein GX008_11490, partial [Firmicutes bacterium]|nr:hypothetical protein [Bacillota bacterium]
MRCNLRLFRLGFFCALFLALLGTTAGADGSVTLFVDVKPGLALQVQESLTFPEAGPGQGVEAELDVTVWSNVGWELFVAASAVRLDDMPVTLEGLLEVQTASGYWRFLDEIGRGVLTDQPPTTGDGVTVAVPFRFTPGYGDAPGRYAIQV